MWLIVSMVMLALNSLNIDWNNTNPVAAVAILLVLGILQSSVIEIPLQTITTLLVGGKRRENKRANGSHLTIALNYNLLATCKEDIDECFETMFMAYIGNLSPNVSVVLVSATNDDSLKKYELEVRDKYRTLLREKLYREGMAFIKGEYDRVDEIHLENVWSLFKNIELEKFVNEHLNDICDKYVDNFMVVHRVSRVLKKCGQYQDLMLLSEGYRFAFSYCDPEYYGKSARKANEPLFHTSIDEKRIHGRKFDYTLVLDGDTGVPRGCALDLLQIAAAHPKRGIIQPSIKMHCVSDDPSFMHIESMKQAIYEPMTNAMTYMLGQSSFYGKGLIKNKLYIDNVIGSKDKLIERVPVDVLSHDTFEAALLKPLYAGSVHLLEAPCYNYITWSIRERRWNRGEILLAFYFWKNTVGRFMRWLQKKVQKTQFNPTKLRTESRLDFVTSYVAHSALRNMFMKPLLLLYICINIGVPLKFPYLSIGIIMFLIIVFPKIAVTNRSNIKYVVLETFLSILQYTPEAVVGCVRLWRAFLANVFLNAKWVPHRAIEEEFKSSNPFWSSIKHLWGYSLLGIVMTVIVFLFIEQAMIMACLLITMILLPLYTGCTTLPPNLKLCKCRNKRSTKSRSIPDNESIKTMSSTYIYNNLIKIQDDFGPYSQMNGYSIKSISTNRSLSISELVDNTYLFGSRSNSLTDDGTPLNFSTNSRNREGMILPRLSKNSVRTYYTYGYTDIKPRKSGNRLRPSLPNISNSDVDNSVVTRQSNIGHMNHSMANRRDQSSQLIDTTYKFGQKSIVTGSVAFR
ncbi:hypothetical protein ACF0H5_009644 [Mactra antiquata]